MVPERPVEPQSNAWTGTPAAHDAAEAPPTRLPREPRAPRPPRDQRTPRDTTVARNDDARLETPPPIAEIARPDGEHDAQATPLTSTGDVGPSPSPGARPLLEIFPVSSTLPADSGLVLIETAHAAAEADRDVAPEPVRPKRVRPPRQEFTAEPLEIVETRKDDIPPV